LVGIGFGLVFRCGHQAICVTIPVAIVIDLNLEKEIQDGATQIATRMILTQCGATGDLKKPDTLAPGPRMNFNFKMLMTPEGFMTRTHYQKY
jgi:hypothetical protein